MAADWKRTNNPIRPKEENRIPAASREITPCSEYSRFTVEGRFPGPSSSMNAVIDRTGLGLLFMAGPFSHPKWSERLGYGMAVIGDDTRVHVHDNGKYIIRRALDRDHASRCLNLLASICHPVVYSTVEKKYLWEMLRDSSLGSEESDADIIQWQTEEGDRFFRKARASFLSMDDRFGDPIDKMIEDGEGHEVEDISSEGSNLPVVLKNSFADVLKGASGSRGASFGISSYFLLARTALWESHPGPGYP